MLTITEAAAKQILDSAKQSNAEGLALRVAAKTTTDGSIEYLLGFDEPKDSDFTIASHGVTIVIDKTQQELLEETKMDYVEIDPGDFQLIFLNPNDPYYRPPKKNSPAQNQK